MMAIFKCLTHMPEIFMAKVTLEGCGLLDINYRQLSASLSKFIYIISSVMHVF